MAEYAQFQRLLVDARAEARAKACSEITSKTAATFQDVGPAEAFRITIKSLQGLEQQFIRNANPAYRRGGMSSVRATISGIPNTIDGLKKHNPEFIKLSADLVLPCFADVDPTVRISAIETAHEMVRKFQWQLFSTSFMELFRALHAIMSDKDRRCLTLGRELSSTVREFVTGSESGAFSPEMFVSFITEAMEPFLNQVPAEFDGQVVQWLLEWINHVYDLPNHELVLQLPRFLAHLYHLIARCPSTEAEKLMERSLQEAKRAHAQGLDIDIREMLGTSIDCVNAIDVPATRKLALDWTTSLLRLGGFKMLSQTHSMLDAVLPQLSAKDLTIRIAAQNANGLLQQLIVQAEVPTNLSSPESNNASPQDGRRSPPITPGDALLSSSVGTIPYYPMLQAMMLHLEVKTKEDTRIASLEWFLLIHGVRPSVIIDHFETVFEAILATLGDVSENVMHKSMEVLHILAGEDRFTYFIQRLLHQFELKAPVLLPKAPTIIKQLQLRYQGAQDGFQTCEKLFLKIAELLPQRQDLRFVTKVTIVLNTMLLTSKEMMPLREVLRKGVGDQRARLAFMGLYPCWCYDYTAVIALCLLATAYSQAYRLIVLMGSCELSPQALIQVDRLVQLLESPVFSFLRISLLQPINNAALVKSLFGLQMILPQASPQYKALHARLKSVPSVAQLDLAAETKGCAASFDHDADVAALRLRSAVPLSLAEWRELEEQCTAVQRQLLAYEIATRSMRI